MSMLVAHQAGGAAMNSLTDGWVSGTTLVHINNLDTTIHVMSSPIAGVNVRAYRFSQFDFPGSESCCTAVAVVAAESFLRAHGDVKVCFGREEDVFDNISNGIVWHSRWLAADSAARSPSKEFGQGQLFATTDEVCALQGMTAVATEQCYGGALVGANQSFGMPLMSAIDLMYTQNKSGIEAYVLTTKGYSTMIGRVGNRYYVFDSHKRSGVNGLALEAGHAVLVTCRDKEALVRYLLLLYIARHKNALYTIQQVGLLDPPSHPNSSTETVSEPELTVPSSPPPTTGLGSPSVDATSVKCEGESKQKKTGWFTRPKLPTLDMGELNLKKWLVSS